MIDIEFKDKIVDFYKSGKAFPVRRRLCDDENASVVRCCAIGAALILNGEVIDKRVRRLGSEAHASIIGKTGSFVLGVEAGFDEQSLLESNSSNKEFVNGFDTGVAIASAVFTERSS